MPTKNILVALGRGRKDEKKSIFVIFNNHTIFKHNIQNSFHSEQNGLWVSDHFLKQFVIAVLGQMSLRVTLKGIHAFVITHFFLISQYSKSKYAPSMDLNAFVTPYSAHVPKMPVNPPGKGAESQSQKKTMLERIHSYKLRTNALPPLAYEIQLLSLSLSLSLLSLIHI